MDGSHVRFEPSMPRRKPSSKVCPAREMRRFRHVSGEIPSAWEEFSVSESDLQEEVEDEHEHDNDND
jgi:hypothetical protein